jgi:hypothetical protein
MLCYGVWFCLCVWVGAKANGAFDCLVVFGIVMMRQVW